MSYNSCEIPSKIVFMYFYLLSFISFDLSVKTRQASFVPKFKNSYDVMIKGLWSIRHNLT